MNTPGVIGIVALQALTAFAVWRFFRRTAHTESAARTVAAPLAAGILLTGAALLIIWKIGLLTAACPAVNWTLIGSVPAVFALGAGYAVRMRRRRPEVYARLATTDVDAEDLAAASPDPQPTASSGLTPYRARGRKAISLPAPAGILVPRSLALLQSVSRAK